MYNPNGQTEYSKLVGRYYYDEQGFRVRKLARRYIEYNTIEEFGEIEVIYPNMYFGLEKIRDNAGTELQDGYYTTNHVYLNGVRFATIKPTADNQNVQSHFYIGDNVDSLKLVTDDAGIVVSRHEYMPYGESFVLENYTEKKFAPKYNMQEFDVESGYYYYNARYYDPQLAVFISPDPVIDGFGKVSGWNGYSYVHGNPIRYSDPTGNSILQDLHDFFMEDSYTYDVQAGGAVKYSYENGATVTVDKAGDKIMETYNPATGETTTYGQGGPPGAGAGSNAPTKGIERGPPDPHGGVPGEGSTIDNMVDNPGPATLGAVSTVTETGHYGLAAIGMGMLAVNPLAGFVLIAYAAGAEYYRSSQEAAYTSELNREQRQSFNDARMRPLM